jgi:hypothetical protein
MNIDFNCLVKIIKKHCKADPTKDTRLRKVIEARAIGYKVVQKTHNMSKSEIGRLFKKNHATIIHGLKVFKDLYETEPFFKFNYNMVLAEYQETIGDVDDEFESLHIENNVLKRRIEEYRCKLVEANKLGGLLGGLPKNKVDEIKDKLAVMVEVAKKDIQPRNQQTEIIQANVIAGV